MPNRTIAIAVLAGSVHGAPAQVELHMTADDTLVGTGRTVTWTLTVQGITSASYFQSYDLNILASDNALALAGPFLDNLTPLTNPSPGTPTDASIFGANGYQSTLLNPIGTVFGDPIVIGTFQVVTTNEGQLSYTVEDGGTITTAVLRVRDTGFGPLQWDGAPAVFTSDTVTIVPPPAGSLVLLGLCMHRRRRGT